MQSQLDILRDVAKRFSEAGIEYMLTGSFALNYYAQPRMTRDIDIVVALEPKDADSVVALFEDDDTPPEIEQKVHEMMMARSGAERLIMGSSMFDAARQMVLASLPKDLPKDEFKRRLFERIYGEPLEHYLTDPAS